MERGHPGSLALDLADFLAQEFVDAKPESNATPLTRSCTGSLNLVNTLHKHISVDGNRAPLRPLTLGFASVSVSLYLEQMDVVVYLSQVRK